MRRHRLHMAAFPLLELAFFVAAAVTLRAEPYLAVALGIASAVWLNFSLHITYHYYVHHPAPSPPLDALTRTAYSVLMGLPFHFYRTLHINHHIHDNAPEDATSTWRVLDGRAVPRGVLAYTLLWPFQRRARHLIADASAGGYFGDGHRAKMRRESLAILATVGLLAWLDWWYVALYYGVFYVGWSLINLHNYGQHLPRAPGTEPGHSFYGGVYNQIFVNNGLHFEHHSEPEIPYWELPDRRDENSRNAWPHTVDGLRFALRERGQHPPSTPPE